MPSSNNTVILNNCIQEYKEKNEIILSNHTALLFFALEQITKYYELSYEEIEASIVDGGRDGGIDAFVILVNEKAINSEDQLEEEIHFSESTKVNILIIQVRMEKSFKEDALDKIITNIPLLLDLELNEKILLNRFNTSLVERIMIFRRIWEKAASKNAKIKIEYAYICKANEINNLSTAFNSKVEQIKRITEQAVQGALVEYNNYSSKELLKIYQKPISSTLNLYFTENPMSICYEENQIGYIGTVNLSNFLSFLLNENNNLRENIFESNIRHFQGNVEVNEGIKDTILNDFQRDFWWLNNGITIIASNANIIGKKLVLNDVQIVNGLQTSFIIADHYKKLPADNRSILVKVIVNKNRDTIDKIISATNKQNPISATLLRASEGIQRNIELFFLQKGYFYDRRKNYYKNHNKPSSKIFSMQFAAQSIESIMNFNPASARATPTFLFKNTKAYDKIFNASTDYLIYLNCCLIVQMVSNYIKYKFPDKDIKNIIRNFTYHIARIVTSLISSQVYYNKNQLKLLNTNKIDEKILKKTITILFDLVKIYQKKNQDENIINIAKSKKFVNTINKELGGKLLSKSRH